MYAEPETWNVLMAKLAEVVRKFLRTQIDAGVDAVQLFDSWVGQLVRRSTTGPTCSRTSRTS